MSIVTINITDTDTAAGFSGVLVDKNWCFGQCASRALRIAPSFAAD